MRVVPGGLLHRIAPEGHSLYSMRCWNIQLAGINKLHLLHERHLQHDEFLLLHELSGRFLLNELSQPGKPLHELYSLCRR